MDLTNWLGPIVRISPEEISLSDIAAAKTIYKVGGPYLKAQYYADFTGRQPYRNLFSAVDFHEHSRLRKLLASGFSEKWIAQMEPFIARNTNLAVSRMVDQVTQQSYTDIFKWFTFMATDVIGESSFGESFEMLRTGRKNQYIHDLETIGSKGTLRSEFPGFFQLLAKLPFGPAKEIYAVVQRMNAYAEESLRRYRRQLEADPDNVKPTLLTKEYPLVDTGEIEWGQIRRDAAGFISEEHE
jgi:cytochrome P450